MDYGKAAYMRAEELTRRMDALAAPKRESNGFMCIEPDRDVKHGRSLGIGTLSADGVLTLIVCVNVTAFDCGSLYLSADGITAGETQFSFLGKSDGLIIASVRVQGSVLLSLECDGSLFARVHKVSVAAIGDNVSFGLSRASFGADENGGRVGIAYVNNDRLFFAAVDPSCGKTLSEREIGGGTAADVVRYGEDGFAIIFRDGFGGLWGALADKNGYVSERVFLGVGGDTVAAEKFGDGFAVAYVRAGKVYVLYTFEGFCGISGEYAVFSGTSCEDAGFVKSAEKLTLWAVSAGKSIVKRAAEEKNTAFSRTAELNVSIS